MLSVSIPSSATEAAFVDSAAKCLATCAESPASFKNQSRAEVCIRHCFLVVNVLDAEQRSFWVQRQVSQQCECHLR